MWSWLQHFLGFSNADGNGTHYLFWSGFGGIVIPPLLTAVPIVWVLLRRHNCHVRGCWRIGRNAVEGTAYVVCRRHHPEGKPTAAHIRERYHLYAGKQPGKG